MVLRQSGLPVLGGLLLGFALTFGLSRLIASLLYGSAAIHPTILATVALALVVSSALAILRPTLAALRVDPMEALRAD
jgi:ABC-type antimicrobial peptide transport system permease subunit